MTTVENPFVIMDDLSNAEKEEVLLMEMFTEAENRKTKRWFRVTLFLLFTCIGLLGSVSYLYFATSTSAALEKRSGEVDPVLGKKEMCGTCESIPGIDDFTKCTSCGFDADEDKELSCTSEASKLLITDVKIKGRKNAVALAETHNFCQESENWDGFSCTVNMMSLVPELFDDPEPGMEPFHERPERNNWNPEQQGFGRGAGRPEPDSTLVHGRTLMDEDEDDADVVATAEHKWGRDFDFALQQPGPGFGGRPPRPPPGPYDDFGGRPPRGPYDTFNDKADVYIHFLCLE